MRATLRTSSSVGLLVKHVHYRSCTIAVYPKCEEGNQSDIMLARPAVAPKAVLPLMSLSTTAPCCSCHQRPLMTPGVMPDAWAAGIALIC